MKEPILDEPILDRPKMRKRYYNWIEIPIIGTSLMLCPIIIYQALKYYITVADFPKLTNLMYFSFFTFLAIITLLVTTNALVKWRQLTIAFDASNLYHESRVELMQFADTRYLDTRLITPSVLSILLFFIITWLIGSDNVNIPVNLLSISLIASFISGPVLRLYTITIQRRTQEFETYLKGEK